MVTDGWVGTAGTVAGCVNLKELVLAVLVLLPWEPEMQLLFTWLRQASFTEKCGMVSHISFSWFLQFLNAMPGNHVTSFHWGDIRSFCEW